MEPGDEVDEYQAKKTWFAVLIEDNVVSFDRVAQQRPSDWIVEEERGGKPVEAKPRHAWALPATALFALQESNDVDTPVGKHRSLLATPVTLQPDLKAAFKVGDEDWALVTESLQDDDHQTLQGSLTLSAVRADGTRQLLVPPASGMVFEQQQLLWLARAPSDATFDYILKRTRITGVIEYYYAFNGGIGSVSTDPDRPHHRYSESAEESFESTRHHRLQTRALPQPLSGPLFRIGEEEWKAAVASARAAIKRRVLFEHDLKAADESVHFVVEYLPLYKGAKDDPSSTTLDPIEGGNLLLKTVFRGRTQVLLQIPDVDGNFAARVNEQDGQPVFELYDDSYYNSGVIHQWVWSNEDGRFLRILIHNSVGC